MKIEEKETAKRFWREWDAFCDPLIAGTRAVDSRKSLQDFQTSGGCSPGGCSKELDMFLRFSFFPPAEDLPPGTFDETPPLLEKALAERIAHAKEILTRILETGGIQNIRDESDLIKAARLSFQELLLPSPPKPGDYDWVPPVW